MGCLLLKILDVLLVHDTAALHQSPHRAESALARCRLHVLVPFRKLLVAEYSQATIGPSQPYRLDPPFTAGALSAFKLTLS